MSDTSKKQNGKTDAAEYSRDAFMTNPVASPTEATGFAVTVPGSEREGAELTRMFKLPNRATGKKREGAELTQTSGLPDRAIEKKRKRKK